MGVYIGMLVGGLALAAYSIPPVSPIAILLLLVGLGSVIMGVRFILEERRSASR